MTSNLGAESTAKARSLGFVSDTGNDSTTHDEQVKRSNQALKNTFRPEFINRIDEVIVFNPLNEDCIKRIARLMLDEVKARIKNIGYGIEFDDSITELVSKEGFDSKYGARPLRRAIVRLIEDSFANMLLDNSVNEGDSFIATVNDSKIEFIKQK